MDYAETRPDVVAELLRQLRRRRAGPPARVVLVVRQGMDRRQLEDLFTTGEAREEFTGLLRRAELARLDADEYALDRGLLFRQAAAAFGAHVSPEKGQGLGPDAARPNGWNDVLPALRAERFNRPLLVLAAALLVAEDPRIDVTRLDAGELMEEVLDRHEAGHWERWNRELGAGLAREDQRRAVALAALLGADTEAEAVRVVRLVPGLEDSSGERARVVARWLSRLYGAGRLDRRPAIAPLEPDLLAEALITREVTALPELLGAALDAASDAQLTRALVVLSRAAGRERFGEVARAALDGRLPAIVRRLAAGRGRDEELLTATRFAVRTLRPQLGAVHALDELPHEETPLATLAAEVTQLAVDILRSAAKDDPDRFLPDLLALSLNTLSVRLSHLGRAHEALAPIEESVEINRALADASPQRYLPDLAWSLNNLSGRLSDLGRTREALAPIEEAVEIRRTLADASPQRYLPDLAMSLNNLSNELGALGRAREALAPIEESVTIRRALADTSPWRYLPDLAASLNNLSVWLRDMGRTQEALAPIQEAVAIRRALADASPQRYRPDLAMSLSNLSNQLGDLGRAHEALAPIEESVEICRALAGASPERFLPDLAASLNNLSVQLSDLGRVRDALVPIEEAVAIRRELAGTSPQRYRPVLASSLNNLSSWLGDLGRTQEALAPIQEAVAICRELAGASPQRYRPDLASSLNGLSNRLTALGHAEEALAPIQEAVAIHRELADASPERYLPDLAMSLNNLSAQFSDVGRTQEALGPIEESVTIYRALAGTSPQRFLPDLAGSLNNLSVWLSALGRPRETLAPIQEAVELFRALADANPERFLPNLAGSLNNLAGQLSDLGHAEEALAPIEEAITIYRELADASQERYLPNLASSLNNLSVQLTALGRAQEALTPLQDVLTQHASNDWAVGVLLLTRATHFRRMGDLPSAIDDTWEAVGLLPVEADPMRNAEARRRLRSWRGEDTAAFDAAWTKAVTTHHPVWLRHLDVDDLADHVLDWVNTPTLVDAQAFLTRHAPTLLTDRGEAALEHLIDANPGNSTLVQHRHLLQDARIHGIQAAYSALLTSLHQQAILDLVDTWIGTPTWTQSRAFLDEHATDLLTDDIEHLLHALVDKYPDDATYLTYFALISLSRREGADAAYALIADPKLLRERAIGQDDTDEPDVALAVARLRAGLQPDNADAHFGHALAAVFGGEPQEGQRAILRCAETSASWERAGYAKRLTESTAGNSGLADQVELLRRVLLDAGSTQAD